MEIVSVLEIAGNDYPSAVTYIYDDVKGDYAVELGEARLTEEELEMLQQLDANLDT